MDNSIQRTRLTRRFAASETRSTDISHLIARLLVALYFVISFFEPYLNGVIGSVTKYYLFVVMAAVAFLYRKFRFRWYHATIFIWFALKLVSVLWSESTAVMRSGWMSHIGMTALLIIITGFCNDRKMNDLLMYSMLSGSFAIGFLSIFFHRAYEGVATRQVLVLFGVDNDPNNQAAFLALGIAAALFLLLRVKKFRFYHLTYIAVIAVNLYSTLMTGSRAGLIALAITALYVFLFTGKLSVSDVAKKLLLIAALAGIAFVIVKVYLPENIYTRLLSFDDYSGGSGREALWSNAWNLAWKDMNFVFGAGWGSYWGYNGYNRVLHNTFLSVFCDNGIVGFALLFTPLFSCFYRFQKSKNIGLNCIILATIVSIFFLEAINKRFFWNALILLLLYYNTVSDEAAERQIAGTEISADPVVSK